MEDTRKTKQESKQHPKSAMIPSQAPHTPPQKTPRPSTSTISMYSVQCGECSKWRVIPTQEEYEEIRKNFTQDPWVCSKKPNVSCEDPADIEYDSTRTWVIDKPNIPKTPNGCKRILVVRSDFSKCDAYYQMPTGKRVRTLSEVEKFLEANPQYKPTVKLTDFNFTVPKIMEETVPAHISAEASNSKKTKG